MAIRYTGKFPLYMTLPQYTSLFTVYESPLIRSSAYTNLRLYESPLHHNDMFKLYNESE